MMFRIAAVLGLGVLLTGACDVLERGSESGSLPTAAQVDSIYVAGDASPDSVDISGNVIQLYYGQPARQLRRGGSLWARVGPYIYLFSPATRDLLSAFGAVGGVRVITVAWDGTEIARAMLPRTAMTDVRWRRSLNLLGHALQQGSRQPTRLEDLVEWGERYTQYRYNERYIR